MIVKKRLRGLGFSRNPKSKTFHSDLFEVWSLTEGIDLSTVSPLCRQARFRRKKQTSSRNNSLCLSRAIHWRASPSGKAKAT
jgi:hypothetical protein